MSQNRSSAVMQQRREPHDSLEDFPTPPWATRALMQHVILPNYGSQTDAVAWEPACNRCHMVLPLTEYFQSVWATDVHDYGHPMQNGVRDFLWKDDFQPFAPRDLDWVITNPPFRLAQKFIKRGCWHASGVAVLVRTSFLEGVGRYREMFADEPPSIIAQFTERVPMHKGKLTATGSTATSYCWLVWANYPEEPKFVWIPPCRKQLELADDYQNFRIIASSLEAVE